MSWKAKAGIALAAGLVFLVFAFLSPEGRKPIYRGMEVHETSRSSKWPKVHDDFLAKHPACAVCGHTGQGLEVHHILSFRGHPELELDEDNLITLCGEHPKARCKAHYWLGHGGNFKGWNPDVKKDAARMKEVWERSAQLAQTPDK